MGQRSLFILNKGRRRPASSIMMRYVNDRTGSWVVAGRFAVAIVAHIERSWEGLGGGITTRKMELSDLRKASTELCQFKDGTFVVGGRVHKAAACSFALKGPSSRSIGV